MANSREGDITVTGESAHDLRLRLSGLGLSDGAIAAAWPRWWSEEAEGSASARAELRFGVARRLGLDPGSILDAADEPRFLWSAEARFKHLSREDERERAGIASFGRALASILVTASRPPADTLAGVAARDLRESILTSGRPFVGLVDLLSLAWGVAVPVVHLRVFPWRQKRMAAMTVNVGDRSTVMIGRDSLYPATIAFYVAHEIGHIALAHVSPDHQIVDLDDDAPATGAEDTEERDADAFALELLTGTPEPIVLAAGPGDANGPALARAALTSADSLSIEPGTLALCFGYSTGDWQTATAALSRIYTDARPVWAEVNAIARTQLELDELAVDAVNFLDAVLGSVSD